MERSYLQGGEVDNTVNIGMRLKDLLKCWLVGDIDLVEDGPLAAQQLDAVQANLGRIVQAVDDDHIVTVLKECEGRERPNVASATFVEDTVSTVIFIPALKPRNLWFVWRDARETRKACLPSDENGSDGHCQAIFTIGLKERGLFFELKLERGSWWVREREIVHYVVGHGMRGKVGWGVVT